MIDNSFHIITFGCQMNVHDSQWLARALEARGFCEAPLEEARVVVVNTCSVREKPEQKVMSTLGRIRQVTGNSPRVLVAVTGCVAQQLGEKLFSRQVRLVAGSDGISGAPQAIERLLDEPALRLSLLDFTSHYVEREPGGCDETEGVVPGHVPGHRLPLPEHVLRRRLPNLVGPDDQRDVTGPRRDTEQCVANRVMTSGTRILDASDGNVQ